jgi:hypothetical protein
MKSDIIHSGKLFEIQRELKYKKHLERINSIEKKRLSPIKDLQLKK